MKEFSEKEFSEIVKEMERLAANLIKLQTISIFKRILSLLEAEEIERAGSFAGENWETTDYEYYALDQGCSELNELSKEQKGKLISLSLWIEKGQRWLIQTLQVELGLGLGGGPTMAMIIDKGLEKGKRAYPALLRELMKEE